MALFPPLPLFPLLALFVLPPFFDLYSTPSLSALTPSPLPYSLPLGPRAGMRPLATTFSLSLPLVPLPLFSPHHHSNFFLHFSQPILQRFAPSLMIKVEALSSVAFTSLRGSIESWPLSLSSSDPPAFFPALSLAIWLCRSAIYQ